uniref:Uncharacterized protein n=1 Tax=Oryza rufipogon TaxID=4529 RepID=A0A0E0QFJ6_ORYRU
MPSPFTSVLKPGEIDGWEREWWVPQIARQGDSPNYKISTSVSISEHDSIAYQLGGPATALSRLTRPRRRAATEGGTARQASDSIESAGRGRGRGGERRRREGRGSGEAEGRGRRPHEAGGICIKKQISRYECGRLSAKERGRATMAGAAGCSPAPPPQPGGSTAGGSCSGGDKLGLRWSRGGSARLHIFIITKGKRKENATNCPNKSIT